MQENARNYCTDARTSCKARRATRDCPAQTLTGTALAAWLATQADRQVQRVRRTAVRTQDTQGERQMANTLQGCKVAVLAVDGFEQTELVEPKRALTEAGATVHVISARAGTA